MVTIAGISAACFLQTARPQKAHIPDACSSQFQHGILFLRMFYIGDSKNLLQMGGCIRGFGLVCQGQTWHSMLRAGGLRWTGAGGGHASTPGDPSSPRRAWSVQGQGRSLPAAGSASGCTGNPGRRFAPRSGRSGDPTPRSDRVAPAQNGSQFRL